LLDYESQRWVINQGLSRRQSTNLVSAPKRLTRASFERFDHLAVVRPKPPQIDSACVDTRLNQLPQLGNEIFDLALRGVHSQLE
jgi:hypothetical protein